MPTALEPSPAVVFEHDRLGYPTDLTGRRANVAEVVGLFESHEAASIAVDRLADMGIGTGAIGYIDRKRDGSGGLVVDEPYVDDAASDRPYVGDSPYSSDSPVADSPYVDESQGMDRRVAESYVDESYPADHDGDVGEEAAKGVGGGAVGGAAIGAGAALLGSAGLLLIPGIGPFLAAGTLAATVGAAAAGAAGGAVVGGVMGAIFGATEDNDETSSYYRDRVAGGSSLVTVQTDPGSESEVARALTSAGAMKVDVYDDSGWAR